MTRLFKSALIVVALLFIPVSAEAAVSVYVADLTGAAESPANDSLGIGFATISIDPVAHTMRVQANFSGLTGTTTAAHIHAATAVAFTGTAGVATTTPSFPGFPSGVSSGVYDTLFDMTLSSSWNPSYITAHGGTTATAEADLFAGIAAGKAYLNIHSTYKTGGEIRGFLVPEPASLMVLVAAPLLLAVRRRHQV